MKRISKLMLAGLLAALVAGPAFSAIAQDAKAEKQAAKRAAGTTAKSEAIPFKGTIGAVDATAKTIKVGERTFAVTSATKIKKEGQPAVFADAKVGEEVGGQYKKAEGDKLELLSLRIGPKPGASDTPKQEKKKAQPK